MQRQRKTSNEETIDIEKQAAALARSMQKIHGGQWRYFIDPISRNVFVTQFSPSGDVRKRK